MGLGIRTFEQRIAAGSDFDGTQPSGVLTRADNIESYPEGIAGGLFDFSLFDVKDPMFVRSVEIKLGGQSVWTVHKRDSKGDELLILCGSDETDFLTTEADTFILTSKQKLVIRTTGATGKLICRVHLQSPN